MSQIRSKPNDRSFDVFVPTTTIPPSKSSFLVRGASGENDKHSSLKVTSNTRNLDQYITPNDTHIDFSFESNSHSYANQTMSMFANTTSVLMIKDFNDFQTSVATISLKNISSSEIVYPQTMTTAHNRPSKTTTVFSGIDLSDKVGSNVKNFDVLSNLSSSNNRLGIVDKGWSRKSLNYSVDIDVLSRQLENGNAISTGHPLETAGDGLHVGAHVTGLISGEIIAISIGCILAFWLLVGPIIYVWMRMRDGKTSRKRGASRDDEMSPTLLEEIIRVEMSKGRAKLYRTSIEDNRELEKFTLDDGSSRRDGRFEMNFTPTNDQAGALREGINTCSFTNSPLNNSLCRAMIPAVHNGIRTLDKVLVRNSFNLSTRTPENIRKLLRVAENNYNNTRSNYNCVGSNYNNEAGSNYNNGAFVGSHSRSANLSSEYQRGIETLDATVNTSSGACFWNAAQSMYSPTTEESRLGETSFSSQRISSSKIAQSPNNDTSCQHLMSIGYSNSLQMNPNCDDIGTMPRRGYKRWDTPLNTSTSTDHFQNESTSLCRTFTGGSLHKVHPLRLRSIPQSSTLGSICEKTPRKFPVMGCRQNSLMQGRESRDGSPTGHVTNNSPVISEMFGGKRSHSDASVRRSRPSNVVTSPCSPHYPLSPSLENNSMRLLISPTEQHPCPTSSSEQRGYKINDVNKRSFVTSPPEGQGRLPVLLNKSPPETLWEYNQHVNNSMHQPVGSVAHRSVELIDSTV